MLEFTEKSFPYPNGGRAGWNWESGYDNHPINELELTRDVNLLACYSAWNALKNRGVYAVRDKQRHAHAALEWLAYLGGVRETLQILGDMVVSGEDITKGKVYEDGTLLTTWPMDLHCPQEKFPEAVPGQPFIARASQMLPVDKKKGYAIPYRALYSRNVPNLFMAGRNVSVDRDALGSVRVMKTIGMMGVTVGRAAAVAAARDCLPRDIYTKHLEEAKRMWRKPGAERHGDIRSLKKELDAAAEKPAL